MRHVPCRLLVGKATAPVSRFGCCCGCVPCVRIAGVKATCQVSRSPEAPARATRGLAPVSLLEVLSELSRRRRVGCRVPVVIATGILSRSQAVEGSLRRCGATGSSCGATALAWSEEEAANRREGPFVGWFLRSKPLGCLIWGCDWAIVALYLWGSDDALVAFLFLCCLAVGRWPRLGSGLLTLNVTGCSCCCATCMASVVTRRVHVVAARSALDSLEVVFLVWRTLASQSRCGAPGRLRRI
ncbi:hypothetical protein Taro_003424 [Colocasia esculenta]|uniref:Uncharacterized protein n=1 Tax=Colocasia esculenta TaxID=4460 RepID=A0A843TFD9_COLES|nr:hypothetical protein [Colocasia esculenta]